MERIVLKMKGSDGKNKKFILPTKDHYQINNLIDFYGLNDYKLITWKIENITTLN